VGREALDPEAMRLLEEHNPDVSFDWARLLKGSSAGPPGAMGAPPISREERRRERRDQRRQRGVDAAPRPAAGYAPPAPENVAPTEDIAATEELTVTEDTEYTEYAQAAADPDAAAPASPVDTLEADAFESIEPVEPLDLVEPLEPVERVELVEDLEPVESLESGERFEPRAANPDTPEPGEPGEPGELLEPRYVRLGADGVRRLRARYADIKSRLMEKTLEEAERAELLGRVERLNPDSWQTEDEVARALEEYETVFESLRPIVGRPPRRRRL